MFHRCELMSRCDISLTTWRPSTINSVNYKVSAVPIQIFIHIYFFVVPIFVVCLLLLLLLVVFNDSPVPGLIQPPAGKKKLNLEEQGMTGPRFGCESESADI